VATTGEPGAVQAGSADIVVGLWSALQAVEGTSEADLALLRLARPGGLVMLVRDYGRDEIGVLTSATPIRSDPSPTPGRLEMPFLERGWKVRVIHCFWTFSSLDEARAFVAMFGEPGRQVAARLTRPRLSHNLALIHRTVLTSP
jgi:hypothetical protein